MEFRIMTYNIYGARLADGKKLAKSIKKYKPDFVALQEVDKNTKRSNFRDVTQDFALELGYNYYYFQKAMDFDKGEFGIAFVSKYDVKNIYVHELPSAGNEKRQVLAAQISSKYKKFVTCNKCFIICSKCAKNLFRLRLQQHRFPPDGPLSEFHAERKQTFPQVGG